MKFGPADPSACLQFNRTQYDLVLGFLGENMGCEVELLATQARHICSSAQKVTR